MMPSKQFSDFNFIHFLFISLLLFSFTSLHSGVKENKHDFHTSLSELSYNPKTGSIEATIRVFTDDLETALTEFNQGKKVNVEASNKQADAIIARYLEKNWGLLTPQKTKKKMEYIGREPELDATWLYVEISDANQTKGYTFVNTLLTELFDDQTNLVNILYPAGKKTILMNAKVKSAPYPF